MSLSHVSALSMLCGQEGIRSEVWGCSLVSKVGEIHWHMVFCTVSAPELHAGNHRVIEFGND